MENSSFQIILKMYLKSRGAIVLFLLFWVLSPKVYGKSFLDSLNYSLSTGLGKTLKHTSKINIEFPEYSYSATLSAHYQSTGKKDWQIHSHYPKYGLSIHYINYNHPDLASAIGFTPEIVMPIINEKKWSISSTFGFGLGWAFNPHARNNPHNNALGSHINNFSSLSLDGRVGVGRNQQSQLGVKFKFLHVSNAAYRIPNLGLNDVSLQLIYAYQPSGNISRPPKQSISWKDNNSLKKSEKHFKYIHAWTQKYPAFGPIYRMRGFQFTWNQPYHFFKFVQLGYHFEYNEGVYSFLKSIELYPQKEFQNSIQQSIFIGHEFRWGKVAFITQLGAYVQTHYLNNQLFYQKLGAQFYFFHAKNHWLKSIYASAMLKTHLSVAEFAEMGIGFYF